MGQHWRAGSPILLQFQLGTSSTPLLDGASDWDLVAESALAAWNPFLKSVSLQATRGSSAVSSGNRVNTVSWGDTVYGQPAWDRFSAQ